MKTIIALTFTLGGALLLAAPLFTTFLLALFDRTTTVNADDRTSCFLAGGFLLCVGTVFSICAFRADEKPPTGGNRNSKVN